jgi:CPA1 family monovalent cation:H+ antiporter
LSAEAAYSSVAQTVVILLAAALVVGVIAGRLRFPYAVALFVVSLPLSFTAGRSFAPSVLAIFLPALVYEAAWHLDLGLLRKYWMPITFLAIPGVAITAFTVGIGLWLAHVMPFLEALLLGAIVSATDPIAVTATFKELRAPRELATIVEGESLCNDGIAAVLYTAVVAVIVGGSDQLGAVVLGAVGGTFGGIALGLVTAWVVALTMRISKVAELQIVATIVAAFGAYVVADLFRASGIFAVLVVAIALRAYRGFPSSREVTQQIDGFWSVLAFISNSIVFILLGLRIQFNRILHEPLLVLLTLGLVLVSRFVLAYLGLPLLGIRQLAWRRIVMLAGMRGALSLALALVLPPTIPYRAQIIDAVFGVVAATLVVQGLTIGPVVRRLNLGGAATDGSPNVGASLP